MLPDGDFSVAANVAWPLPRATLHSRMGGRVHAVWGLRRRALADSHRRLAATRRRLALAAALCRLGPSPPRCRESALRRRSLPHRLRAQSAGGCRAVEVWEYPARGRHVLGCRRAAACSALGGTRGRGRVRHRIPRIRAMARCSDNAIRGPRWPLPLENPRWAEACGCLCPR